jgi:hypothetical protein|tara:strand:- start:1491 stop:1682 length:192 start_codon:yes stop_codon:yes gene_type:complete
MDTTKEKTTIKTAYSKNVYELVQETKDSGIFMIKKNNKFYHYIFMTDILDLLKKQEKEGYYNE